MLVTAVTLTQKAILFKKRCVEKGKHDYALNLILILCFQNGNTKFQNGVNSVKFLFLIFGGVVVNGCYKK
jgi:hypothetical protein